MRIVYLHQYFTTVEMAGGTRSFEFARRLVERGHDVHMVTSRRDAARPSTQWFETDEHGIRVHWLPLPYANQMAYRERLVAFARFARASAARAACLDGDVVFASSTPLTIALPGAHAARRLGRPMVLEVRDLWPEAPIAVGALRDPLSRAGARWLERFAYRRSARIVALSPDMAARIADGGYPAERITVIPNACDVDLFDVGAEPGRTVRERYTWLGDRPLIVYTGTLGLINGVSYLARLAAEVQKIAPDVCFAIIGEGREENLVRRTAADLEVLDRNFFMLPSMPKGQMPAWLSAANLATSTVIDIPALGANSANKVFDAFAAAKPIAINHEGWLADVIRETGCGLVLPPRDYREAAARVVEAVRDASWLASAKAAARQLAASRFNRERLTTELERVLLAAATEPGSVRRTSSQRDAEARQPAAPSRPRSGKEGSGASVLKRALDLVVGSVALVVAAPLIAVAALLIVWEDRGPALFGQRRAGHKGRPFNVLKLRTMQVNRLSVLEIGQVDTEHPLVTRVGRTLRRYKIDELAQLVNVVRGEMSLVGPRPVAVEVVAGFTDFERRRLAMRPGMTGWAQVNGGIRLSWEERNALDVWYVEHWSMWLDIRILARTLGVVLAGERPNRQALDQALAYTNGSRQSAGASA